MKVFWVKLFYEPKKVQAERAAVLKSCSMKMGAVVFGSGSSNNIILANCVSWQLRKNLISVASANFLWLIFCEYLKKFSLKL